MSTSNKSFISTPWSLVLRAADRTAPDCRQALQSLCAAYWYPVYAFVRRHGHAPHVAEDLTQEFFLRLLEKDYLGRVDREKGRFRTFLLVCVRRFLCNEHDRAFAMKRGGGRTPLPIDFGDAEDRYTHEPADRLTPERVFERRWALTVLETALAAMEEECAASGKRRLFDALKVYLAAEQNAPPYAATAAHLGMQEGAIKVAVYRLRQRFARLVRQEVTRTIGDPAEAGDEIRALFEALGP